MTARGPVQATTAWSPTRGGGGDVYVMRDERDDEEGALQREVRGASQMRRAPSMVLMQQFANLTKQKHPTPMSASLLS